MCYSYSDNVGGVSPESAFESRLTSTGELNQTLYSSMSSGLNEYMHEHGPVAEQHVSQCKENESKVFVDCCYF